MLNYSHLTLAVQGAGKLLEESAAQAQAIAESWNERWENIITPESSLYATLARVGVVFAVASFIIWVIAILKDFAENQSIAFAHELIWPIIVIFLLRNNGSQLSQFTLLIRQFIHQLNQQVLTNTAAGFTLQEAFQKAKNSGAARAEIGALLQQCQALTGTRQIDCLKQAKMQAESIISAYGLSGDWATNLLGRITDAVSQAGETGNFVSIAFTGFNALIGAANQSIVRSFLLGMQVAFQETFECSLLLTALLGPLAVGGSLLPITAKPIVTWLTGLFSVGIAKLCFNIMCGLSAAVVANAKSGDPLWFLIFIGFLAPLLSMALAAGGGMAVWSTLAEAGNNAAGAAADLTAAVVTRGKSK